MMPKTETMTPEKKQIEVSRLAYPITLIFPVKYRYKMAIPNMKAAKEKVADNKKAMAEKAKTLREGLKKWDDVKKDIDKDCNNTIKNRAVQVRMIRELYCVPIAKKVLLLVIKR